MKGEDEGETGWNKGTGNDREQLGRVQGPYFTQKDCVHITRHNQAIYTLLHRGRNSTEGSLQRWLAGQNE